MAETAPQTAPPQTEPECRWARLKPYNVQRRHLLQRCHFLGRLWEGGDGINKIPEWVKVNLAQAAVLARLRQDGTCDPNPGIPRAFDIVTEARKLHIDRQEEAFRKAALGIGAPNITEMPDVTAPESDATGNAKPVGRLTLHDLEDAPPPPAPEVDGDAFDDDEIEADNAFAGSELAPNLQAAEIDISQVASTGRLAAAEGFEEAGSFDLNDGQDVNDVAPQAGKAPGEEPDTVDGAPPPKSSR